MSTPTTGTSTPRPATPLMWGVRLLLGTVGVLGGLYGLWLLLDRQEGVQLRSTAVWLVGGLIGNDGVVAAIALLVMAIGGRLLPAAVRAPAAVGFIVLATVTVVAVPVLGRFGERPDNATLLDGDYGTGWLIVAGITLVSVIVASVVRLRRARVAPSEEPAPGEG